MLREARNDEIFCVCSFPSIAALGDSSSVRAGADVETECESRKGSSLDRDSKLTSVPVRTSAMRPRESTRAKSMTAPARGMASKPDAERRSSDATY